jgi:hypothetical protein
MGMGTYGTRTVLLGITLILGIGFLAATTEARTQWKEITEEKAKLLFYWPGPGVPRATFKQGTDSFSFLEMGHWQAGDGLWPQVYIVLRELKADLQYTEGGSLREGIEKTFNTMRITFGAVGTSANGMGKLELQRFTLHSTTEIACVGMRQSYGPLGEIPGKRALGDSLIFGWYCAEPGATLSEETITQFLRGIGVRGIALPQRSIASVGAEGDRPYRIGIFPAAGNFGVENRSTQEKRSADILRAIIGAKEEFVLSYSDYHAELREPRIKGGDRVWTDDVIRKKPKLDEVSRLARERDLDAVVMAWGDTPGGWGVGFSGDDSRNPVFMYLVDVEQRKVYRRKGTFADVRRMGELVFADFLKNRPEVVRAKATPAAR